MNNETNTDATVETILSDAERVETGTVVEGTDETGPVDVEALKAAAEAAQKELLDFKREVAVITGRYATTHGMCGTVDSALAELGLQRPKSTVRVSFSLTGSLDMLLPDGHAGASNAEMWAAVHALAYALRHNSVAEAVNAISGDPKYDGTVIESAEVVSGPVNDATFLRPGGRIVVCPSCGRTIGDTSGKRRPYEPRNNGMNCTGCY